MRLATKAREAVCYEVYDRMIHVFPMFSSVIPLGQIAINRWADFVSKAIEGEKMPVGQAFAIFEDTVEPLHKQDVHPEKAAMAQAA
mmetsp:Transcript_14139/g.13952  ORF Transcript_14139/g.13952 Transcript_14139/m.13952 type:complete len:86 (-) Transcript_14139:21-278(-)